MTLAMTPFPPAPGQSRIRFQGNTPPAREATPTAPAEPPAAQAPAEPKFFLFKALTRMGQWLRDFVTGLLRDLKLMLQNFKDLLKGPPEHVHGPDCDHGDHHDHAHGTPAEKTPHVCGPACDHHHPHSHDLIPHKHKDHDKH